MDTYGEIARAVPTRQPNGLNSTGPVEQVFREIDRRIGSRVGSFTNRARLVKWVDRKRFCPEGEVRGPSGKDAGSDA